jgi:hypothetical protein
MKGGEFTDQLNGNWLYNRYFFLLSKFGLFYLPTAGVE